MRVRVAAAAGASVQDLGRLRAHQGLSTGGARDQHAARTANALSGRPPGEPLAEVVLGELAIVPDREALAAVTGGCAAAIEGVPVETGVPLVVPAGAELRLRVERGVAGYLAVAGRWRVPVLAGGAGPDRAIGIDTGLRPGDAIEVVDAPRLRNVPQLGVALIRPAALAHEVSADAPIDLLAAPDVDAELRRAMARSAFEVDPRSDDVGVRLRGPLPERPDSGARPSRGVPVGAVELPGAPDELIVLQRRRSLTAGYPIVAVAGTIAQDRVAQRRPGDAIRFRWREAAETRSDLAAQREFERSTARRVRAALESLGEND